MCHLHENGKVVSKMKLTWLKNEFICKELYAPFKIDKDTDYRNDLEKKYNIICAKELYEAFTYFRSGNKAILKLVDNDNNKIAKHHYIKQDLGHKFLYNCEKNPSLHFYRKFLWNDSKKEILSRNNCYI